MNIDFDENEPDSIITSQEYPYLYFITSGDNFKPQTLKLKYNNIHTSEFK
jgi:hypothetical protein